MGVNTWKTYFHSKSLTCSRTPDQTNSTRFHLQSTSVLDVFAGLLKVPLYVYMQHLGVSCWMLTAASNLHVTDPVSLSNWAEEPGKQHTWKPISCCSHIMPHVQPGEGKRETLHQKGRVSLCMWEREREFVCKNREQGSEGLHATNQFTCTSKGGGKLQTRLYYGEDSLSGWFM